MTVDVRYRNLIDLPGGRQSKHDHPAYTAHRNIIHVGSTLHQHVSCDITANAAKCTAKFRRLKIRQVTSCLTSFTLRLYTRMAEPLWLHGSVHAVQPQKNVKYITLEHHFLELRRTISKEIKLRLYFSIVVSTATYACETWKTTAKAIKMIEVFHRRCLRRS